MKNILNNFKEILGQYCAINQFVELGKRCFVTEHQKALETREEFVELAIKNSITLTCYDADKMVNDAKRLNPDVQVIKASLKQGEGLSEIISAINKQKDTLPLFHSQ